MRYATRYHIEPPAFVHPKRSREWEQLRAMDDETRCQSYVLPLFVQYERIDDEYGTSVYPTTLEQARERYQEQRRTEADIARLVDQRLRFAEESARVKALMALQARGRGDRQKAARSAAEKFLRDVVHDTRSLFEEAAKSAHFASGDERHGFDELMAVVEAALGDTQVWSEATIKNIVAALQNTLDDMQDLKAALAASEQANGGDLAPMVVPFKYLDGVDIETFGRLRLITPELREQVEAIGGHLNGSFAPVLPKEWEVATAEIAENETNMSAGRYKPFVLAPVEHDPPAAIIRELQALEARIQDGLAMLLSMVEGQE